jgi:hypothetical protein
MREFTAGARLHGGRLSGAPSPAILWGYRPAIILKTWSIKREQAVWKLRAEFDQIDPFQARQRPLLFSAPRKKGFWLWPVEEIVIGNSLVEATLGAPEQ